MNEDFNSPEEGLADAPKGGLGLIPNEVVGYRIVPDDHNWTVCLVRKYGAHSAKAGQEYYTPMAYCASLQFAADWILNRDARQKTEMLGIKEAFIVAKHAALSAVYDLEARLKSGELTLPAHSPITSRKYPLPTLPGTIPEGEQK